MKKRQQDKTCIWSFLYSTSKCIILIEWVSSIRSWRFSFDSGGYDGRSAISQYNHQHPLIWVKNCIYMQEVGSSSLSSPTLISPYKWGVFCILEEILKSHKKGWNCVQIVSHESVEIAVIFNNEYIQKNINTSTWIWKKTR